MSSILCAKSGIQFKSEHFAGISYDSREISHPIFYASHKTLLDLSQKYFEGNLSPAESYLLFVALFSSTRRVDFRTSTIVTPDTLSIVANNMESLVSICERIWGAGEEKVNSILHLTYIVISHDTSDLSGAADWISIWNACFKDFEDNYKSSNLLHKIASKESSLEAHIKDKTKDISSYASQLAIWASLAGRFPEEDAGNDMLSIMGKKCSLSEYWRAIIVACAKKDNIFKFPLADVQELISECEEFIPQGSIYAFTLMTLLREGRDKLTNLFSIGDIDIGRNGNIGFKILDASAGVEDANLLALIESAPASEPIESAYPNKLAYLKARANYRLKQAQENAIRLDNIKKES